jgi:hypothetical protein
VSADELLIGPPYVQVKDSRYCSSAWDENCCDLPNGHDEPHWDKTNGNRWTARASLFSTVGHKRAIQGIVRFLLFLRADEDEPKRQAFKRAGGDVVCDECGQAYCDHVQDPIDEWLNVLCSGERVKL